MEKRAVLAIALSVLVLFAFKYIEDRKLAARRATAPAPAPERVQQPIATPAPTPPPPAAPVLAEEPAPSGGDTRAEPRSITVEGKFYRAVLETRGGVLTRWTLRNYRSSRGAEFEMISAGTKPENRPYPGALIIENPALNWTANGESYEVAIEGAAQDAAILTPPVTVSLALRRGPLHITKRYKFHADNYLVDYALTVRQAGAALPVRVLLGQDLGPEDEHIVNPLPLQSVANIGGSIKRQGAPSKENEVHRVPGEVAWAGLDMQYFTLIAIPTPPLPAYELQKVSVKTTALGGKEIARDLLPLTLPIQGAADLRLFIGPKEESALRSAGGTDLSGAIDFGIFSFLVRPLLFSLKVLVRYVHNYGVAIIVLTLLLTLLLFPFRLKQMTSMKKMQVVQPKVKEIQERYKRYKKTDPKRAQMNQEIMALYKQHNVNPLGGCLPLLLQMPLLFAFYQLLAASIELRQAPFVGWIHDLAVKDPYYVLPIIMGVTMLISQRMTPMSPGMDPTQAKMMMMMPVVFTVMFFNVSSGLNLYFLCSNIFQIGFQKLAEKWMGDGAPKSARA